MDHPAGPAAEVDAVAQAAQVARAVPVAPVIGVEDPETVVADVGPGATGHRIVTIQALKSA